MLEGTSLEVGISSNRVSLNEALQNLPKEMDLSDERVWVFEEKSKSQLEGTS